MTYWQNELKEAEKKLKEFEKLLSLRQATIQGLEEEIKILQENNKKIQMLLNPADVNDDLKSH